MPPRDVSPRGVSLLACLSKVACSRLASRQQRSPAGVLGTKYPVVASWKRPALSRCPGAASRHTPLVGASTRGMSGCLRPAFLLTPPASQRSTGRHLGAPPIVCAASWLALGRRGAYCVASRSGELLSRAPSPFEVTRTPPVTVFRAASHPPTASILRSASCTPQASVCKVCLARLQPVSCVRRLAHLLSVSLMLRSASVVLRTLCCVSPCSVSCAASRASQLVISCAASRALQLGCERRLFSRGAPCRYFAGGVSCVPGRCLPRPRPSFCA